MEKHENIQYIVHVGRACSNGFWSLRDPGNSVLGWLPNLWSPRVPQMHTGIGEDNEDVCKAGNTHCTSQDWGPNMQTCFLQNQAPFVFPRRSCNDFRARSDGECVGCHVRRENYFPYFFSSSMHVVWSGQGEHFRDLWLFWQKWQRSSSGGHVSFQPGMASVMTGATCYKATVTSHASGDWGCGAFSSAGMASFLNKAAHYDQTNVASGEEHHTVGQQAVGKDS